MTTPITPNATRPLFSVQGLIARAHGPRGEFYTARDVSLEVAAGEAVGLVGESGVGKSLAARAMIRLLGPDGSVDAGAVTWEGNDLARVSPAALRRMRGREIALMPQDSPDVFDPFASVGAHLTRIVRRQSGATRRAAREAALDILRRVGIAAPEARLRESPRRLPSGTRRRVLLAMSLICKPRLLVADEPTRGLDKTAEAEILALLAQYRREHGMAVLLLSHDISAVARLCERVAIMYGGRIVETGFTHEVMASPRHPYTRGLVASIPRGTRRDGALPMMRGEAADLAHLPTGCAFQPRCPEADPACRGLQPLRLVEESRRVACWRAAAPPGGKRRP